MGTQKEVAKQYYLKNRLKIIARSKERWKNNKKAHNKSVKKWKKKNWDKCLSYQRKRRKANPLRENAYALKYYNNKVKTLHPYYLKHVLKRQLKCSASEVPQEALQIKYKQLKQTRYAKDRFKSLEHDQD